MQKSIPLCKTNKLLDYWTELSSINGLVILNQPYTQFQLIPMNREYFGKRNLLS